MIARRRMWKIRVVYYRLLNGHRVNDGEVDE